jgi:hypothetical protein
MDIYWYVAIIVTLKKRAFLPLQITHYMQK